MALSSSTDDILSYSINSIVKVEVPEDIVLKSVAYPRSSERGAFARTT